MTSPQRELALVALADRVTTAARIDTPGAIASRRAMELAGAPLVLKTRTIQGQKITLHLERASVDRIAGALLTGRRIQLIPTKD